MLKKTCCCLCLSINRRTINIYRTDLLCFYELLANYKIRDSECWMCYICQTRLQQCHRLQQLAVQTRGLVDGLCQNKFISEFYSKQQKVTQKNARWKTATHQSNEDGISFTWSDGEKLQETDIDIGAIGSLIELSIYMKKNISITPPTADNIKEEPDIKTEQYNEDETIEEETLGNANTNEEDYAPVLEFEDDDVSDSDAICEQESMSVDRIDTWQGSRVLELKLEKLSQSIIDKYVLQSPTTQHTATEEHVGDKGKCAGEQSVENDDKKAQYKSHKEQLICNVCLKMFPTKTRFLRHIRTHTGEKRFACDICEKKFYTRRDLTTHIQIHTGEDLSNCDICKKKFTSRWVLKRHLVIHTGEKAFKCDICQKKFLTRRDLKKHLFLHTGEKPYKCDKCLKKFARKDSLQVHLLTFIHTGEKPYNCDICKKKFTSHRNLKRHLVIHTGEKLVKLSQSVIDKYVRQSPTTQHTATEEHVGGKGKCAGEQSVENDDKKAQYKSHKEQLICNVCLKMFPTRRSLLRHIRTHTGEKRFVCDICEKKFYRRSHLTTHIRIHTGENLSNCDVCKKKFTLRSHLERHLLTHTGEKPYNCNICQKKFGRKDNLSAHLVKNHIITAT